MAIIRVKIDLSGLTAEESRSFSENEYDIGGYCEDYIIDAFWANDNTWLLSLDTRGDFSESELRNIVLREYVDAINKCKLDRYAAGLKPNDSEVTFYDTLRNGVK
jgi:hypothetical protein